MPESTGKFEDVCGAIGSLIWLWVGIKRCAEGLEPDRPVPTGTTPRPVGVSARLVRWQKRMQADAAETPFRAALALHLNTDLLKAKRIRNGVCHGLCGIEGARGGRPGRLIWRIGGRQECLSWDEMQVHLAWLSKIPGVLEILDRGDFSSSGRLVDTPENRAWWAGEYGIDLNA